MTLFCWGKFHTTLHVSFLFVQLAKVEEGQESSFDRRSTGVKGIHSEHKRVNAPENATGCIDTDPTEKWKPYKIFGEFAPLKRILQSFYAHFLEADLLFR